MTAADSGKTSGTVGENALSPVERKENSAWRLTVIDEDSEFSATVMEETSSSITVYYENAYAGDNGFVSLAVVNEDDEIVYYGNIAQNSAEGTQTVNYPSDLPDGTYSLRFFTETVNGDRRTDSAAEGLSYPLVTGVEYTVTFDPDGGKIGEDPGPFDVTCKAHEKVAEMTAPSRDGYEFLGWYLDDKLFDFETRITSNLKLVAKWSKNDDPVPETCSVVYDLNGGSFGDSSEDIVETYDKGTTIQLHAAPRREGFTFLGWEDPDGSRFEAGSDHELTANRKFIAQWEENKDDDPPGDNPPGDDPPGDDPEPEIFTITYKLAGGSFDGSTADIVESHEKGTTIQIHAAPERSGYSFLYWEGSRYNPGQDFPVTSDHTFTARWEENPTVDDPPGGDDGGDDDGDDDGGDEDTDDNGGNDDDENGGSEDTDDGGNDGGDDDSGNGGGDDHGDDHDGDDDGDAPSGGSDDRDDEQTSVPVTPAETVQTIQPESEAVTEKKPNNAAARTGDEARLLLWAVLLVAATALLGIRLSCRSAGSDRR